MCVRLREQGRESNERFARERAPALRLHDDRHHASVRHNSRNEEDANIQLLAGRKAPVPQPGRQRLPPVRGSRHSHVWRVARFFRALPCRYGGPSGRDNAGSLPKRGWKLRAWQLQMGDRNRAGQKPARVHLAAMAGVGNAPIRCCCQTRNHLRRRIHAAETRATS